MSRSIPPPAAQVKSVSEKLKPNAPAEPCPPPNNACPKPRNARRIWNTHCRSEKECIELSVHANTEDIRLRIITTKIRSHIKIRCEVTAQSCVPAVEINAVHAGNPAAGVQVLVSCKNIHLRELLCDYQNR